MYCATSNDKGRNSVVCRDRRNESKFKVGISNSDVSRFFLEITIIHRREPVDVSSQRSYMIVFAGSAEEKMQDIRS